MLANYKDVVRFAQFVFNAWLRTRNHKKSQLKGMKIKKCILASDLGCERKSHEAPGRRADGA